MKLNRDILNCLQKINTVDDIYPWLIFRSVQEMQLFEHSMKFDSSLRRSSSLSAEKVNTTRPVLRLENLISLRTVLGEIKKERFRSLRPADKNRFSIVIYAFLLFITHFFFLRNIFFLSLAIMLQFKANITVAYCVCSPAQSRFDWWKGPSREIFESAHQFYAFNA